MLISFINETFNSKFADFADLLAVIAAALIVVLLVTIIAAAARARSLKRKIVSKDEEIDELKRKLETMKRYATETQYAASSAGSFEHDETHAAADAQESAADESAEEQKQTQESAAAIERADALPSDGSEKAQEEVRAEAVAPQKQAPEPQQQAAAQKQTVAPQKQTTEPQKQDAADKGKPALSPWANKPEPPQKYVVKYDSKTSEWIVIKTGNTRASRRVKTKVEALAIAKELSKNNDTSLVVHKKDGKFQKQ